MKKISDLKKSLDKYYARYIKCINTDYNLMTFCVTCGKPLHIKGCECGHYVSRRHEHTRWDIHNSFPQCTICNNSAGGMKIQMGEYITEKFGIHTKERLDQLAFNTEPLKPSKIEELEKMYKLGAKKHPNYCWND